MALRLPESVMISGKPYKVKKNPKRWGGNAHSGPQTITVGTARDQSAQRKFDNYVHEVAEAVTIERNLRFTATDDDVKFVMDHKQFDNFAVDIATALWPMIKKR